MMLVTSTRIMRIFSFSLFKKTLIMIVTMMYSGDLFCLKKMMKSKKILMKTKDGKTTLQRHPDLSLESRLTRTWATVV